MRRLLGAVTALVCVGLLSSCSLLPSPPGSIGGEERVASAQMEHIADAVRDHEASALKRLFSPRAREDATDLDAGLTYFLSAFPSGPVTWKTEGTSDSAGNVDFKHITELFGNYEVSANGKKYELFFAYFSVNDFHPDEVGIYALGVEPYDPDPFTASGARKPFYEWASQFDIDEKSNTATGNPGIYVPQN
jgi:hypothetical protein